MTHVDLHVTAPCGCFIVLTAKHCTSVAMCLGHSARLLPVFDGPPDQVEEVLVGVYGEAIQRVRLVLDDWDRLTKGPSPTTKRIRAAIEGVHADGSSR